MRHVYSSNRHGCSLQIVTALGRQITLSGELAFVLHAEIMRRPKGPVRAEFLRLKFAELEGEPK